MVKTDFFPALVWRKIQN